MRRRIRCDTVVDYESGLVPTEVGLIPDHYLTLLDITTFFHRWTSKQMAWMLLLRGLPTSHGAFAFNGKSLSFDVQSSQVHVKKTM